MAEAASISYGNEFSSGLRKNLLSKHTPASSKDRESPKVMARFVLEGLRQLPPLLAIRPSDEQPRAASASVWSLAAFARSTTHLPGYTALPIRS